MAVAASLNGGNVLDYFVRSMSGWVSDLGLTITEGNLNYRLLINKGNTTDTFVYVYIVLYSIHIFTNYIQFYLR